MSTQVNKAIARRYFERSWDEEDVVAADEIYAQDYLHLPPSPWQPAPRRRDEVRQVVARMRRVRPGSCVTIEDMIAEGDRVAIRWSLRQAGSPSMAAGITIQRIVDGRVVEVWDALSDSRARV